MTDKELRDLAVASLKKTSISYPEWTSRQLHGKYPDVTKTEWWKAFDALNKIGTVVPPPPPTDNIIRLSGNVSPSEFWAALPSKPVVVQGPFTLTGSISPSRANVTIIDATILGTVQFSPGGDYWTLRNVKANGWNIHGAHYTVLENCEFDGQNSIADCEIWDSPAGNAPHNWKITGCKFINFGNPSEHSQGIYVGYCSDGEISNCFFQNNGNTSHIWFDSFGEQAYRDHGGTGPFGSETSPRRICVKGNKFSYTKGAYFAMHYADSIPNDAQIRLEPSPSNQLVRTESLPSGCRWPELFYSPARFTRVC